MEETKTKSSDSDESRKPSLVFFLPLIAILAILGLATVFLTNGGNPALPGNATSSKSSRYAGLAAHPLRLAPPIRLTNNLGRPVTLNQYRGKVVLVTFLYVHCPDVCPLIAANLHTTLEQLGPASQPGPADRGLGRSPWGHSGIGRTVPERARADRPDAVPDRLPGAAQPDLEGMERRLQ